MAHIFDSLERRRLLSVTFNSGVVRVTGTGGSDVIEFQLRADDEQIRVKLNATLRRFPVAEVRRIIVDARAGNDVVEFSERDGGLFVRSSVLGGAGSDRLEGGSGSDTLRGGSGRDRIRGLGGADRLDGQSGSDFLQGDAGNDRLDGGPANDDIRGGSGDDRILGGDGDDDISGGLGTDIIFGQAGNDDFDDSDSASEIEDLNSLDDGANGN